MAFAWKGLFGAHCPCPCPHYPALGGAEARQNNVVEITVYEKDVILPFWWPIHIQTVGALSPQTTCGTQTVLYDQPTIGDATVGPVNLQSGRTYAIAAWVKLASYASGTGWSCGAWSSAYLAPMDAYSFAGQSYTQDGYVQLVGAGFFDVDPDHTAPTTFIASGPNGGSHDHPVSCTLGATDGAGYGVQAVHWQLDDGPWQPYNLGPPAAVITITEDAVLRFYGVDVIGNTEPAHEVAFAIRPPNTWRVPLDAATIQAGIDSAAAGDTVVVACGTYYEHAVTLKSGVTVRSETGQADCAIVDAGAQDRVFTATGLTGAVLKGFTIANGLRSWGAGVHINGSSMTVENCLIRDNVAHWPGSLGQGGGMEIESCSPTLRNLTIVNNSGPEGAGLALFWASPALENCIVAFNDGVSAYCYDSSPSFACSDIHGNTGGDWVGAFAGQQSLAGNLAANPYFCTSLGSYALDAASPCLPAHNGCGELIGALGEGCAFVAAPGGDEPGGDEPAGGSPPPRLALAGVVPNPFNPAAAVRFGLPGPARVRLEIFDAAGRRVAVLTDGAWPEGWHEARWDGRDLRGAPVAAGVYFCRLSDGRDAVTERLTLLR